MVLRPPARGHAGEYSLHDALRLHLRPCTVKDGKRVYTHERLRRARRSLNRLVKDGALFMFVEAGWEHGGTWPSTNNAAESVNARLHLYSLE